MKDELGDRMKGFYENRYRIKLLKRPLIRNDHDEEHLNKMTADESKSSTL